MSAETRAHSLIPPQEQHGPRPFGPLNKSIPSSLFSVARVCRPWLLAPAHGPLEEGISSPCSGQEAGFLPDSWRYRYTRKFTSSLVMLFLASPGGDEVFTKQQPPPSVGKGERRKRRDVSDAAYMFLLDRVSLGKQLTYVILRR